ISLSAAFAPETRNPFLALNAQHFVPSTLFTSFIPPPPSLCRDSQKLVTDPLAPLYAPAPRCRAGFVSTSLRDNWNSLRQNAAMQALHIPVKRRLVGSTPPVVPWCDPGR